MNNILTIMRKELFRFFKDKRMVFTILIMPGLMIYLIYTVMGGAFSSKRDSVDDKQSSAYVVNMPDEFKQGFEQMKISIKDDTSDVETMKKSVEDKNINIAVIFPENFINQVAAYDSTKTTQKAPQVEIFYNSASDESSAAYNKVSAMLEQYENSLINKFDINADPDIKYDVASDKEQSAQILAILLPMFILVALISGCVSIAPESIAGEKERGTLTTILVTPVKRSELAIGKIVSLSIIALLSGLSSFAGIVLSLPKYFESLAGDEASQAISTDVYGVGEYAVLLGIVLCTVLVMIAIISVISAYAKTVKEAGTYVSPFMIIVMIIAFATMFGGEAQQPDYMYAVPIYNSVQSMQEIFTFKFSAVHIGITCVSDIIFAGIFVFILTKMFNSEKIILSK